MAIHFYKMDLDARKLVLGEGVHTTKAQTTCTSAQSVQRLCYSLMDMGGGGGGGGGGGEKGRSRTSKAQTTCTSAQSDQHFCYLLMYMLGFDRNFQENGFSFKYRDPLSASEADYTKTFHILSTVTRLYIHKWKPGFFKADFNSQDFSRNLQFQVPFKVNLFFK